jgi:tetratricopeptide (TPR) repeat protein
MYPFAHKEFFEAYRQIDRLYDREDKYLVLKGLVEVRYIQVYEQILDNRLKKEYISEGINYARKALEIFPNSRDVNLYLGMFYFNNPEPDDVKAKDQFLKVVEIDPLNTDAYIALAELYQKHRNGKKAFLYARKALHIDPNNLRARQILNLTE